MDAKLQAQVRSLTREVGALREALRQEEGKRERLAAHAKACDEARAGAEAKVKSLTYVNTKLEQEVRSARERGDVASAKSRAALQDLRARLVDVERSVHQRSVQAVRHVHRLQAAVQELQATAMLLAVAVAAAAGPGGAAHPPALRSPRLGPGSRPTAAAVQRAAAKPEQLHRGFATVFAGLTHLAALFSGGSSDAEGTASPLLLTAPDGSTRTVHWQDQNSPANSAGGASAGSQAGGAAGAAGAAAGDAEKQRLVAEVVRLRGALAEARQQAAAAAASGTSSQAGGGGRVEEAMRQLDAVVPQYRAAAQALQGQVAALRQQLTAAARERDTLRGEVGKWRAAAQRHEAALAEATAKLHTREAQSLAASTQAESRAQGELGTLRQRCASLAGQLQEAQRSAAQHQGSLAAKERLAASQQQTIRRLEATIQEQQADIRAALALVSSRPAGPAGAAGEHDASGAGLPGCGDAGPWGYGFDGSELGAAEAEALLSGAGWDAALAAAEDAAVGAAAASAVDWCLPTEPQSAWDAGELAGGADTGASQLEALLGAATAAADAAAAWAGGFGDDAGVAAGWLGEDLDCLAGGWTIPAAPASPAKSPAATATAAAGSAPGKQHRSKSSGSSQAAVSLQGSPATGGQLAAVEADIAGLEQALRSALTALSIG